MPTDGSRAAMQVNSTTIVSSSAADRLTSGSGCFFKSAEESNSQPPSRSREVSVREKDLASERERRAGEATAALLNRLHSLSRVRRCSRNGARSL